MSYPARLHMDSPLPMRAYFFGDGPNGDMAWWSGRVKDAFTEFENGILGNASRFRGFSFALGLVRYDGGLLAAEIMGYKTPARWPGDPETVTWQMRGDYIRETDGVSHNALRIFASEETFRRQTKDMRYFMENDPEIPSESMMEWYF